MSKNNVHPDHYKVGGRDRQDDAAAARFARAVAAKASSRERPDRMTKGPYFQRTEPPSPASAGSPAKPAQKKSSPRAGTAKRAVARKASAPKRPAARKTTGRTGRRAKPPTRKR